MTEWFLPVLTYAAVALGLAGGILVFAKLFGAKAGKLLGKLGDILPIIGISIDEIHKIEKQFPEGNGEKKKEAVVKSVKALAEELGLQPISDGTLGVIVNTAVALLNRFGALSKGKYGPSAPTDTDAGPNG